LSASLSKHLGARAFTHQNHVFFSGNQFQPGTSEGKQLLAHELAHTLQQGQAVRRKAEVPTSSPKAPQAAAAASNQMAVSSEVVDISSNIFTPSQKVKDEIEAQGGKGLDVRVIVKGLTGEGRVKIRVDRNRTYDSIGKGWMPVLNAWAQQMGGMYINFTLSNSEIKGGYASLKPAGGDTNDWLQSVQKNASLIGGLGLKVENLPAPVNKFENGKLTLGVTNLKVEVGGFVDALFNLAVENSNKPKIDATADVNIKGMAKGQLKLDNSQDKLTGQVSLSVDYKSFSGSAIVRYNADGTVDITGKAAYNANKLSGEVQFVSTDLDSANKFAKDAIAAAGGKENVQNAAPPGPVPIPKAGKKQRALAATGQLGFNLTTWFAGAVNVVVDGKGAVTVIGKIAPPAEIELFKQRDWDKELIKFEAKAYYGIPVVGNLNLFANISLHALARLGPAKIYNIEILGTYSTDPEVQKNIQISGSINISGYGGLRLRAEGGAGIEIASHDLKFGIGLNADVGVKAYADARPTIGYRDPGVFYVSGTLEMVAQPVLGLSGDFFIKLETPWWSPLSDDKWVWPLFSKEWPLSDPIGISASVKDYVLGSGAVPEIELKKPEFDPSKFMTSMVDKTLPDKSGGPGTGQGAFKEDGSVLKPEVKPKKSAPKQSDAKPGKKGAPLKGGKSGAPDPKAAKDQQNIKILQNAAKSLAALKGKAPLTRSSLDAELTKIKGQVSGVDFGIQLKDSKWVVSPKAGGRAGKGLELLAKDLNKDGKNGKPEVRTEAESKRDKLDAIADAEKLLVEKDFSEQKVRDRLSVIKTRYRLLTLNLVVDSKTEQAETVHFIASASKEEVGRPKEVRIATVVRVAMGDWVKNLQTSSYEQVSSAVNVLRRTAAGTTPVTFLTNRPDGGGSQHTYDSEGTQWERSNFKHGSNYVMPLGGARFALRPPYRRSAFIRPNFYLDTSASRSAIVARKLPGLLNPANLRQFLSEAPASLEAAQGYTQKLNGKAVIPASDASPDHDPPIARHWTKEGNNVNQAARENWNKDPGNFKLMSLAANLSLGSRGDNYTENAGVNFRGPGE
jgi:hypothetical protein